MAQRVKPLLHRPEAWNSDVHIIHGKSAWACQLPCNSIVPVEAETGNPLTNKLQVDQETLPQYLKWRVAEEDI